MSACTSTSTAHPLHAHRIPTNTHSFLLRPESILASSIEEASGFSPFLFSAVFSHHAVSKLATQYLNESTVANNKSLSGIIKESTYSIDTLTPLTLNNTIYTYIHRGDEAYLIQHDFNSQQTTLD